MRAIAGLLLSLLVLSPGAARAEDDDAEAKKERAFLESVNDAIDRGVLWLVDQQKDDGSWPGYEDRYPMGATSLALLTVLNCDYPRKSETVKSALNYLYERYQEQNPSGLKTYSVALLMMALEEAWAPLRGQPVTKEDRYGTSRRLRRVNLPNREYKWMAELARWMVRNQTDTVWRYPGGGIDHSNTQFALLGLSAALRCGVTVPRETFLNAATHLLEVQEKDGPEVRRIVHVDQGEGYARRYATNLYDRARGWGYVPDNPATGSMTTAGVASLAICRSELMAWPGYKGPFGDRMERGIKDGLAWLDVNFSVEKNPGRNAGWHYYYLYGLERAGVLTDVTFLGDHDWYREGAEYLVRNQGREGAWPRRGASLTDTCFALLFLRRATVPVRVPREVTPRPTEGD